MEVSATLVIAATTPFKQLVVALFFCPLQTAHICFI